MTVAVPMLKKKVPAVVAALGSLRLQVRAVVSKTSASNLNWVSTIQAMKCQGQDGWTLLMQCVVTSLDDQRVVTNPSSQVDKLDLIDESATSPSFLPERPPPRVVI